MKAAADVCGQPRATVLAHHPGDALVPLSAARLLSAWQTSSQTPSRSNSAASDVGLARFDLRIVRAMQSSRARGETAECVALL